MLTLERYGVFDLETTGVNPHEARVVSAYIGLVDIPGGLGREWEWLVNPGVPIPPTATEIHGITDAMVQANGLPAADAIADIVATLLRLFTNGVPVVAFNARYDLTLIDAEHRRHNRQALTELCDVSPVIDPFVLDKAVDTQRSGKRTLEAATRHYGVTLHGAHGAKADAIAAGQLAERILGLPMFDLDFDLPTLHRWQVLWAEKQAISFRDWRLAHGYGIDGIRPEWPLLPRKES